MIERMGRVARARWTPEDEDILCGRSDAVCHRIASMIAGDRRDAEYIYCRVDAAITTGERFCRWKYHITPERCVPCSMFDKCKHL